LKFIGQLLLAGVALSAGFKGYRALKGLDKVSKKAATKTKTSFFSNLGNNLKTFSGKLNPLNLLKKVSTSIIQPQKTKTSFLEKLKGWLPNSDKKHINYVSKQLSTKFEGLTTEDLATIEKNLKGADKQTFKRTKRRIKIMTLDGFNQWKANGFTTA
jgi:hypothetical protein